MHPLAHGLLGGLFAVSLVAFGVELPRRRQGLGRSGMSNWTILLVIIILGGLAAFPQVSRFFGDRKLDTGPAYNLYLFHDVLNLAGQRFRLGNGLLDPPVTLLALAFGVAALFLVFLRSGPSVGWNALWRDVAYFAVVVICLVAIRSVVSGKSYLFMPQTRVWIHREPFVVVGDTVFSYRGGIGVPTVGISRDKAIAVREAFLAVNATNWSGEVQDTVSDFLRGNFLRGIPPLEYESLVSLMAIIRQVPGGASPEDIDRVIQAGSLPRNDIPITVAVGGPIFAYALCGILLFPYLDLER